MIAIVEMLVALALIVFCVRKFFGYGLTDETTYIPQKNVAKVKRGKRKSVSFSDTCDKIIEEKETEEEELDVIEDEEEDKDDDSSENSITQEDLDRLDKLIHKYKSRNNDADKTEEAKFKQSVSDTNHIDVSKKNNISRFDKLLNVHARKINLQTAPVPIKKSKSNAPKGINLAHNSVKTLSSIIAHKQNDIHNIDQKPEYYQPSAEQKRPLSASRKSIDSSFKDNMSIHKYFGNPTPVAKRSGSLQIDKPLEIFNPELKKPLFNSKKSGDALPKDSASQIKKYFGSPNTSASKRNNIVKSEKPPNGRTSPEINSTVLVNNNTSQIKKCVKAPTVFTPVELVEKIDQTEISECPENINTNVKEIDNTFKHVSQIDDVIDKTLDVSSVELEPSIDDEFLQLYNESFECNAPKPEVKTVVGQSTSHKITDKNVYDDSRNTVDDTQINKEIQSFFAKKKGVSSMIAQFTDPVVKKIAKKNAAYKLPKKITPKNTSNFEDDSQIDMEIESFFTKKQSTVSRIAEQQFRESLREPCKPLASHKDISNKKETPNNKLNDKYKLLESILDAYAVDLKNGDESCNSQKFNSVDNSVVDNLSQNHCILENHLDAEVNSERVHENDIKNHVQGIDLNLGSENKNTNEIEEINDLNRSLKALQNLELNQCLTINDNVNGVNKQTVDFGDSNEPCDQTSEVLLNTAYQDQDLTNPLLGKDCGIRKSTTDKDYLKNVDNCLNMKVITNNYTMEEPIQSNITELSNTVKENNNCSKLESHDNQLISKKCPIDDHFSELADKDIDPSEFDQLYMEMTANLTESCPKGNIDPIESCVGESNTEEIKNSLYSKSQTEVIPLVDSKCPIDDHFAALAEEDIDPAEFDNLYMQMTADVTDQCSNKLLVQPIIDKQDSKMVSDCSNNKIILDHRKIEDRTQHCINEFSDTANGNDLDLNLELSISGKNLVDDNFNVFAVEKIEPMSTDVTKPFHIDKLVEPVIDKKDSKIGPDQCVIKESTQYSMNESDKMSVSNDLYTKLENRLNSKIYPVDDHFETLFNEDIDPAEFDSLYLKMTADVTEPCHLSEFDRLYMAHSKFDVIPHSATDDSVQTIDLSKPKGTENLLATDNQVAQPECKISPDVSVEITFGEISQREAEEHNLKFDSCATINKVEDSDLPNKQVVESIHIPQSGIKDKTEQNEIIDHTTNIEDTLKSEPENSSPIILTKTHSNDDAEELILSESEESHELSFEEVDGASLLKSEIEGKFIKGDIKVSLSSENTNLITTEDTINCSVEDIDESKNIEELKPCKTDIKELIVPESNIDTTETEIYEVNIDLSESGDADKVAIENHLISDEELISPEDSDQSSSEEDINSNEKGIEHNKAIESNDDAESNEDTESDEEIDSSEEEIDDSSLSKLEDRESNHSKNEDIKEPVSEDVNQINSDNDCSSGGEDESISSVSENCNILEIDKIANSTDEGNMSVVRAEKNCNGNENIDELTLTKSEDLSQSEVVELLSEEEDEEEEETQETSNSESSSVEAINDTEITQPIENLGDVKLSQSMEDLLSALQEETLSQQADDKRIATELDSTVLTGDLLISDRRNKLETSAQGWRKRVGPHDATLFSVAGRMGKDSPSLPSVLASSPLAPALVTTAQEKKTPQANRFRSRRAEGMSAGLMKSISTAAVSQPVSPKKPGIGDFKRSISVSGVDDMATDNSVGDNMTKSDGGRVAPSVPVPRADDETFTSFFTSASQTMVDSPASNFIPYNNNNTEQIAEDIDLDAIDSGARQLLSVTGVNRVRATRRAGGSRNPLRALAARTDLRQEYTEPPATGVADKEAARLRKDKIAVNSPMAVEALAGLASREDFTAVHLKKTASGVFPLGVAGSGGDAGSILLIHVKGRRRVQVRLVEPVANSVNSGDCFVLVTPDQVFNYIGLYSNVIERSRASDIALHIHTKKDLGCVNSTSIITLDEQVKHRSPRQWKQFWNLLGVENDVEDFVPTPAGNADEDEIFETGIMSTNMCYEVSDDELVPIQEYWGQTPKIAMLDPSKILVFDFGSELYVWNGKNTILENRRRAFQLAQELWDEGYDYKDCHICPLNIHQVLGARQEFKETSQKDTERPPWTMITKVTQHMETILFKEKFLDWPDFTRVIRVKEEEDSFKGAAEIKPCNVDVMWNREYEDPSLVLEGSHVGRGTHYYDKETMRHFEVKTKSVTKWIIQEYDYVKIDPEDLNEFYSGDSYIIRWEYQITVTGRELNGKPSKHNLTGRDRCAYFCWQGKDATANEKGAAALLTVELDHEKGPQVRVTQSCEPLAFLNLFKGSLVIHRGKKGLEKSKHRLYAVRGNIESESHLVQVACSMRQLRSRASMIIVESETGKIYVWHGVKSLKHTRAIALEAAKKMALKKNSELFDSNVSEVEVTEVKEDDEPKSVIDILGGANRELYHSLVNKQNKTEEMEVATTPRLFHFTDLSGQFDAIEVLSPLRHESLVTAYPFSQQELYSASQPGLYLLDCGDRLWLWQGWWPQQEDSESIETGSGTQRWQACRRAAMETVLEYWKLSRPSAAVARAYLAVAGLEPLPFTNMFDDWRDRDDIAELNIAYGHKVAEGETSVAVELCRLSRTSFPLAVLRQRPLPEAVDPAHIEKYLIADEFQETFNMTKEEFYELPAWKQANIKRDLGLF